MCVWYHSSGGNLMFVYLGMYMTWIVFIRDGSENKISGKAEQFINFKKRCVSHCVPCRGVPL